MDEIVKSITTFIDTLRKAGLLRLSLAVLAFLGTILVLHLVYRILSRRLDLSRVRGSVFFLIFLIGALVFSLTIADSALLRVVNSILVFFMLVFAIRIVDYALIEEYLIRRRKLNITRLPRDTIKGILFIILFLIALNSFFGISLQGLGITAAVMAGVIGFALQDTLSSVIAGISISMEKPFQKGDWVRVAGIEGRVEQISWRTTRIRTFNDDYIILPNYNITRTEVFNFYTPSKVHSRELKLGVDYSHEPEQVKDVILESLASTNGVIQHPVPRVRVTGYGDFAIQYLIKFWIRDFALYPDIENEFFSKIWYSFRRRGITIPFPIRDVRMRQQPGAPIPGDVRHPTQSDLATLPIMKGQSKTNLKLLAKYFESQLYGKGETVFRVGDPGDYFYIIARGSVRVERQDSPRRRPLQLESGEVFGEVSMITGRERNATVTTEEETLLYRMRREDFAVVLKRYPAVIGRITRIMKDREKQAEPQAEVVDDTAGKDKQEPASIFENLKKYFRF